MDPMTFPVLAAPLLGEAGRFLLNRASSVLDRWSGRVPGDEPEQIAEQPEALRIRSAELTDTRIERITQAQGALTVYLSRPELLQGDDERLRELLGQLRHDLEEVYGRGFPFGEEQRPQPGVFISQRADLVDNKQVGVRAQGIAGTAHVQVDQSAKTIGKTAEQVGAEIEGTIG
ncbi:hypothetical protein DI273_12065 [Streptomyces violascens]|uniref:hypothetical protein n=1 Tax=Streptomyces albidoflavus TaxID=1886 RepID=UPI0018BFEC47|nr:hypothetical protein DI273_12065 [Streptomyces violascens]